MERFASGTKWEPIVGYSRAVKAGPFIHVSGTTGTAADGSLAETDAYGQTVQAIANIRTALEHFGATLEDVARTRMFVTDIERDWEEVGRAHGEFFSTIRPATAMVEVRRLIDPAMLVEIEATAFLDR